MHFLTAFMDMAATNQVGVAICAGTVAIFTTTVAIRVLGSERHQTAILFKTFDHFCYFCDNTYITNFLVGQNDRSHYQLKLDNYQVFKSLL